MLGQMTKYLTIAWRNDVCMEIFRSDCYIQHRRKWNQKVNYDPITND